MFVKQKQLDLLIVGAGPAGLQCAKSAVEMGLSCLVVERAKSFLENNFSSGAAPLEIMTKFSLPESIVEKTWSRFQIVAEDKSHVWQRENGGSFLGVILGFHLLREYLKDEATKNGALFFFKSNYLSSEIQKDKVISKIKRENEIWEITSSFVIDATGGERKVIRDTPASFEMTGSEVWVNVDPDLYRRYDHTLTFFLGPNVFPQGYAWVFPQSENCLKIGVIRYFQGEDWVPHPLSFSLELESFVQHIVGKKADFLTRHGKSITYCWRRKGPHVKERILAVGDAASTVNPMGCEGLRYALESGELAAKSVVDHLKGNKNAFLEYQRKLAKLYNLRWYLCEWVAKTLYRETNPYAYKAALEILEELPLDRLMKVLFEYDPLEMIRFGAKYQWKRLWLPE